MPINQFQDSRVSGHGEIAGATSATVLPTVSGKFVLLKAEADNAGSVYIGLSNAVTAKDGATDATTGYELAAGDELALPITNLNTLWRICTNAGDDMTYLVFS